MTKIAGSGSGYISQKHGSADPDPHQNVMDPQHCCSHCELTVNYCISNPVQVRFRIKEQPWFVSDITTEDFHRTLERLSEDTNDNYPHIAKVGCRWKGYLSAGKWAVSADPFWTYPHVFCRMAGVEPQLYGLMSEASLCIFKGDLNYRKLVGDLNWEAAVPFRTALQVCKKKKCVAFSCY